MSDSDRKKFIPHIIVWLLGAFMVLCGRSWLFWGGMILLAVDFLVLLVMLLGCKFEKKHPRYFCLLVPAILVIMGLLRMSGKIVISGIIAILCLGVYAQSEAELISSGDSLNHNHGDYNVAAERYWQAAAKYASQEAVVKLSDFYKNTKKWFERDYGYNWQMPRKYIQKAADAFYPQSEAEFINTDFIVVASEEAIIGQAVWNLQNKNYAWNQGLRHDGYTKFPGQNLCGIAIDIIKKDIKISGKHGNFLARSRYFDGVGNVAVVDRDTANRQFSFTNNLHTEWIVYVRCPVNKNLLIPFSDFHRYLYQEKMAAFISICRKMAAKSIKISYSKMDQSGERISVGISGKVANYAEAKAQVEMATHSKREEENRVNYEFDRSWKTQELSNKESCWLDSEPTWREMYESRHKTVTNQVKKFNAVFTYNESYKVDVNAALHFGKACWKVGVDTSFESERFLAVQWDMEVEFFTAIL